MQAPFGIDSDLWGAANENERLALVTEKLADTQRENAKLRTAKAGKVGFKVGEKGGVSVTGLGRFPTTLYLSQWERLIAVVKDGSLERFIETHRDELSVKEAAA